MKLLSAFSDQKGTIYQFIGEEDQVAIKVRKSKYGEVEFSELWTKEKAENLAKDLQTKGWLRCD